MNPIKRALLAGSIMPAVLGAPAFAETLRMDAPMLMAQAQPQGQDPRRPRPGAAPQQARPPQQSAPRQAAPPPQQTRPPVQQARPPIQPAAPRQAAPPPQQVRPPVQQARPPIQPTAPRQASPPAQQVRPPVQQTRPPMQPTAPRQATPPQQPSVPRQATPGGPSGAPSSSRPAQVAPPPATQQAPPAAIGRPATPPPAGFGQGAPGQRPPAGTAQQPPGTRTPGTPPQQAAPGAIRPQDGRPPFGGTPPGQTAQPPGSAPIGQRPPGSAPIGQRTPGTPGTPPAGTAQQPPGSAPIGQRTPGTPPGFATPGSGTPGTPGSAPIGQRTPGAPGTPPVGTAQQPPGSAPIGQRTPGTPPGFASPGSRTPGTPGSAPIGQRGPGTPGTPPGVATPGQGIPGGPGTPQQPGFGQRGPGTPPGVATPGQGIPGGPGTPQQPGFGQRGPGTPPGVATPGQGIPGGPGTPQQPGFGQQRGPGGFAGGQPPSGPPEQRRGSRIGPAGAAALGVGAGLVGGFLLSRGARAERVDEVRGSRREFTQDGVTVIHEPGRTIIRDGEGTFIRHDENARFRDIGGGGELRSERRGNETVTFFDRPGGVRVITVTDQNGQMVRRIRRYPDGREVILIDNSFRPMPRTFEEQIVILPEPEIRIPRERYVVDADRADEGMIYEALTAPPVQRPPRRYTLDEVRHSPTVRAYTRSVDVDTINFDLGSWEVKPDQISRLDTIAAALGKAITANPNEVFLIEGHTDKVGNDVDNLSLSDRRAQAIAAILTQTYNIPPENLTTQGYGEQYPKVQTEAASRENRRVTLRRVTELLNQQNTQAPQQ
jgi:outer membrane protein OmpA-like peptidoglycan-associated protein